ncbi:hypothetical protein EDD16DRAFT_1527541 [Pisolithus croceorrhizus]|nr:hypothetical protein EDD16DRAFT_1527541 [Pisolithus croceorrhizus]KAI6140372.1 hypothetical protein EDD17DRAFT_1516384 [Pisolithus thermaeus]
MYITSSQKYFVDINDKHGVYRCKWHLPSVHRAWNFRISGRLPLTPRSYLVYNVKTIQQGVFANGCLHCKLTEEDWNCTVWMVAYPLANGSDWLKIRVQNLGLEEDRLETGMNTSITKQTAQVSLVCVKREVLYAQTLLSDALVIMTISSLTLLVAAMILDSEAGSHLLVACSHVCCQWRAITTTSPLLWARVVNLVDDSEEWVAMMIQRSEPHLLDVSWDYTLNCSEIILGSTVYQRDVLAAANNISWAFSVPHRVHSINLRLPLERMTEMVVCIPTFMPNLGTLVLAGYSSSEGLTRLPLYNLMAFLVATAVHTVFLLGSLATPHFQLLEVHSGDMSAQTSTVDLKCLLSVVGACARLTAYRMVEIHYDTTSIQVFGFPEVIGCDDVPTEPHVVHLSLEWSSTVPRDALQNSVLGQLKILIVGQGAALLQRSDTLTLYAVHGIHGRIREEFHIYMPQKVGYFQDASTYYGVLHAFRLATFTYRNGIYYPRVYIAVNIRL